MFTGDGRKRRKLWRTPWGALGMINPFVAAVLHNLSTLMVVFNSARLIHYDPDALPGRAGPALLGKDAPPLA